MTFKTYKIFSINILENRKRNISTINKVWNEAKLKIVSYSLMTIQFCATFIY